MTGLVEFSIIAGKHVKSNAIIITYEYAKGQYRILGMGAGQPNRLDSVQKLSVLKAKENLMRQYFREQEFDYPMLMDRSIKDKSFYKKLKSDIEDYSRAILSSDKVVLFSDAFFPKRDGLCAAADTGIKYIVSPGGSKGDKSVVNAANENGVSMIFTGIRHFKH